MNEVLAMLNVYGVHLGASFEAKHNKKVQNAITAAGGL